MRIYHSLPFLILASSLRAAEPFAAAAAPKYGNLLNPNISAIGWFQGEAGRRHTDPGQEAAAAVGFKELELALQATVDPYAKADFFLAVEGDGTTRVEEGYLTWIALPGGLQAKAGKFRADLGKFNRTHASETAFADRPLVHERFFGAEGLAGAGGALSWHVPNPWLLVSLDGSLLAPAPAGQTPTFAAARRRDVISVARVSAYQDLSDTVNATWGASLAQGPAARRYDDITLSSSTLFARVAGLDLTVRWKDPRRAIYRSFLWQTEAFWSKRDAPDHSSVGSTGVFTHVEYQFARRWRAGARYDYTQLPDDRARHEKGGLAYLTFMPSEFSLLSLQLRQTRKFDGAKETLALLKLTFNIGPHGAHPF